MDPKGVRRSGNFAKRNSTSTKLSRKIGWLNNHAGLQEEIRFADVKELLAQVGDEEAFMILQNLEKKARDIQKPTNYIISSARNSLGGNRGRGNRTRPRWNETSKEEANPDEPMGSSPEGEDKDFMPDAPNEPEPDAMEEVEDVPVDGEEADAQEIEGDAGEEAEKVEDHVRFLNSMGSLSQELQVDRVVEPLVALGIHEAMEILAHLEEKASEVRDPTAYVLSAARQRGKRRPPAAAKARRQPGRTVAKTHLKDRRSNFDPAMVDKVRKRISWLNDKAGLSDQLSYEKVGELLLRSGPIGEVMKILKTLEENAAEVRNPNGYVATAARRLQEEGVAPEPKSSVPPRVREDKDMQDFRHEPLDKQLEAHIMWLNREVQLNGQLDYDQVARPLLNLDPAAAGEILRRLEEHAKEVRDPNGYVLSAAQRAGGKGGGKGPPRLKVPEPPLAPRAPPSAEDEKIARRVSWLNQHIKLPAPLDFDRLASSFRKIGYYPSLEVLNNLEEHADTVRDPTAYVIAGIRKVADGEGAGMPAPSGVPVPAPPAAGGRRGGPSGHSEEKLQRRVEWLNKNVCSGEPLFADRVIPVLLPLRTTQALDILKNFEESADSVRDPNAYVIGTARRAAAGESIRSAPREGRQAPPEPSRRQASRPTTGGSGRAEPIGSFSSSGGRREASRTPRARGDEDKLRGQVNWLNDQAGLQTPLDEERVVPQLQRVGDRDAMQILKRLEDSAGSIRDPTAYVISALRRVLDGGKGGRPGK
ncbi:unnamed protein product [Effrenium voratum]|nr:unnamed protein product [Effrenium voratum]